MLTEGEEWTYSETVTDDGTVIRTWSGPVINLSDPDAPMLRPSELPDILNAAVDRDPA